MDNSKKDLLWFNDNIVLGVTKIRLSTWTDEKFIIPIDTTYDDFVFSAIDNYNETAEYETESTWEIIADIIWIEDPMEKEIQNSYFIREIDGLRFYRAMRANLVKMLLTEQLTSDEVDLIDLKVEKGIAKMITGDWISTKYRIEESTVEGAYTQEYKDELLRKISTYIETHYDF